MKVDSYKYMSRLVSRFYKLNSAQAELPIPWSPLTRPLAQCKFGLITSGGLYHPEHEPPFDLEREQREPAWGDPSFRTLPSNMDPAQVEVSHFHIQKRDVVADMNILLPIQRFQELADSGRIGGLASNAYSFMGYQGFPADLSGWKDVYGPQVAQAFKDEGVDCILLTTA